MPVTQGIEVVGSAVQVIPENRADTRGFKKLTPRIESDSMKLYPRVLDALDNYFLKRGLTYLPGQRELLAEAVEAVLKPSPGRVTAIPFQPGLGKSTLIRALLKVFSSEFRQNTSIAQALGGVIVVVEKTSEAEGLEELCNGPGNRNPVAKAISSPNDYNLAQGRCANGTATAYQECPGRGCPDYADCELAQSASQTQTTPILIMLHARYQRYMEDMTPFLIWNDDTGQHTRTLLLVDELPPMVEENALSLKALNEIETGLDQLKPSYQRQVWNEKSALLYEWDTTVRNPYLKLSSTVRKSCGLYGMVSRKELEEAGFVPEKLEKVTASLGEYLGTTDHPSINLVDILQTAERAYYAVGQDFSLIVPRLCKLSGETQPATFLFSGTASLSPELSKNPDIDSLPDHNLESFQRLRIHMQRGDIFNSSKSGLDKPQNRFALAAWLRSILPQIAQDHKRILVVTYKSYAERLWNDLREFHNILIPYIGSDGNPQPKLPYFGGLNGSNLYREATCVICAGLNRFEPKDYISRALAIDFDGLHRDTINAVMEAQEGKIRLDRIPCVMEMQDIELARDIVQLVFRSALRNHGEDRLVDLWLLQPPDGVIRYLQDYFMDCQINGPTDLPEDCQIAVTVGREYLGKQTHAGKLLGYLHNQPDGVTLTPSQIRDKTGLTPGQFKETKKHPQVQRYFKEHFSVTGSGRNAVYTKMAVRCEDVSELEYRHNSMAAG